MIIVQGGSFRMEHTLAGTYQRRCYFYDRYRLHRSRGNAQYSLQATGVMHRALYRRPTDVRRSNSNLPLTERSSSVQERAPHRSRLGVL